MKKVFLFVRENILLLAHQTNEPLHTKEGSENIFLIDFDKNTEITTKT